MSAMTTNTMWGQRSPVVCFLPSTLMISVVQWSVVRTRDVHGNGNTNMPKMGMGRVYVKLGMGMTTFNECQNSHRLTGCECKPMKYCSVTSHSAVNFLIRQYEGQQRCGMMDFLRDNRTVLPKMFSLARRILCIPASSAATERVFDAAGRLLEKRRTTVRTWHGHQTAWTAYNFWTAICDISLYVEDNRTLRVADSELRFWNWDTSAFAFWMFCILIVQR